MLHRYGSIPDLAAAVHLTFPPFGAIVRRCCKLASVSQLIVPELADEGGRAAKLGDGDGDCNGDIGSGAARGLEEAVSLRKGHAGDGGDSQ